jgi:hypothetical protein
VVIGDDDPDARPADSAIEPKRLDVDLAMLIEKLERLSIEPRRALG